MGFLLEYWKEIVIALLIIGFAVYIKGLKLEAAHYKAAAQSYEQAIDNLNKAQALNLQTLQTRSDAVTGKYKESLATSTTVISAQQKVIGDKIHENKELKSQLISATAVQLFNDSTHSGPVQEATAATAKQGNDDSSGKTTADLLSAATENNARLLRCDKQVDDWINFWHDVEAVYDHNSVQ